jgi:hypothetical protein
LTVFTHVAKDTYIFILIFYLAIIILLVLPLPLEGRDKSLTFPCGAGERLVFSVPARLERKILIFPGGKNLPKNTERTWKKKAMQIGNRIGVINIINNNI